MTPRFSGRLSIFSLAFFVLKSLLGIASGVVKNFAILSLKVMLHETIRNDDF